MKHITVLGSSDIPWIRISDFNKLQSALVNLQRKYDISISSQNFKIVADDMYDKRIKQSEI